MGGGDASVCGGVGVGEGLGGLVSGGVLAAVVDGAAGADAGAGAIAVGVGVGIGVDSAISIAIEGSRIAIDRYR